MGERYELRQGSRILNAIDDDGPDRQVEVAVARERLEDELRQADQADEDAGLSCDC